jgi:hypothetical protein
VEVAYSDDTLTSLLCYEINYNGKRFYSIGPWHGVSFKQRQNICQNNARQNDIQPNISFAFCCSSLQTVLLKDVMLIAILLNVVLLNVVLLKFMMLNVVLLGVVLLNVIMLNVALLNDSSNVILLNVILIIILLNVMLKSFWCM